MDRTKNRKAMWLAALALAAGFAGMTAGAQELLVANFADTTEAVASGGRLVKAELPANPAFAAGPGGTGRALVLDAAAELLYPIDDAWFDVNCGTLDFWIKPEGWGTGKKFDGTENIIIPVFTSDGGQGRNWDLLLYLVYRPDGRIQADFRTHMLQSDGTWRTVWAQQFVKEGQFAPDQWSRVTLTWSEMTLAVYVNGAKVADASYGLPTRKTRDPRWKLSFMPRRWWNGDRVQPVALAGIRVLAEDRNENQIADAYAAWRAGQTSSARAEAPVPTATRPVRLDGRLDADEWADATLVPLARMYGNGIHNGDLGGRVLLKRDGHTLWIGFGVETPVIDNRAEAGAMDKNVFNGSEFEVWWRAPDAGPQGYHQLALGANGAWAHRAPDDTWTPFEFRRAVKSDDRGWSAEIALDFAAMGLDPDASHDFQFVLHRPEFPDFDNQWLAWNVEKPRQPLWENMGRLHFAGDPPAVRLGGFGMADFGDLAVALDAARPLDYRIDADFADGQTAGRLTPGGAAALLRTLAPRPATLRLTVTDAGRGWLVYDTKFLVREPLLFEPRCHAARRVYDCRLDLRGLRTRIGEAAARGGVRVTLSLDGDDDANYGRAEATLDNLVATVELPFTDPPAGTYRLTAAVAAGDDIFTKTLAIVRPSDEFVGNRLGLERTVPAPFAPLARDGGQVRTALLTYDFAPGLPFPVALTADGEKVFAEAPRFVLVIGGKEVTLTPKPEVEVESADDSIVATGRLASSGDGPAIVWRREIAYDGLIRYDFTLAPGARPVTVDRFAVTAVVAPGSARYLLAPNYQDDWRTKGAANVFPSAWLTGINSGFCLFTDNDANWVHRRGVEPIRLRKNGDGAGAVTAELIETPTALKEAAPYVLAMMGTPAKRPPADWRAIHDSGWGRLKGQTTQIIGWAGMGHLLFKRTCDLSQPVTGNADYWTDFLARREAGVKKLFPYTFFGALPSDNPIHDYYGPDWEATVDGGALPRFDRAIDPTDDKPYYLGGTRVCVNKGEFVDYFIYYFERFLRENPGYIGLYTDGGGYSRSDTPFGGTDLRPVLAPDKTVRNYNAFGTRLAYERAYKVIRALRGDEGLLYIHNWDNHHPAINSFTDMFYPGEEFMHSIRSGLHVYVETPLEKWQSNYNGRIMGASTQFLGQWRYFGGDLIRLDPERRREYTKPVLAMCLIHDIPLSGAWYPDVEATWQLFDDADASAAEFVGYWHDGAMTTDDEQVKASFYRWRDHGDLLVAVGTIKREPARAKLAHPTLRLDACRAVDAYTGEAIDLTQPIELEAMGFRVIRLSP